MRLVCTTTMDFNMLDSYMLVSHTRRLEYVCHLPTIQHCLQEDTLINNYLTPLLKIVSKLMLYLLKACEVVCVHLFVTEVQKIHVLDLSPLLLSPFGRHNLSSPNCPNCQREKKKACHKKVQLYCILSTDHCHGIGSEGGLLRQ